MLHLLFKSSPNKLSGAGSVFVLALNNKKKHSALLKFDSAKTALLGRIDSLKPLCIQTAIYGISGIIILFLQKYLEM